MKQSLHKACKSITYGDIVKQPAYRVESQLDIRSRDAFFDSRFEASLLALGRLDVSQNNCVWTFIKSTFVGCQITRIIVTVFRAFLRDYKAFFATSTACRFNLSTLDATDSSNFDVAAVVKVDAVSVLVLARGDTTIIGELIDKSAVLVRQNRPDEVFSRSRPVHEVILCSR